MTKRLKLAFSRPNSAQVQAAQTGAMDGDEMRALLEKRGVDTVVRLHRLLARAPSATAIDLGDFLQDVAGAAICALSVGGQMRPQFTCVKGCLLPPETVLPIGTIVVELVTNAVKYAHPAGVEGVIHIACDRDADGMITVEVSDDGVGLPEGMDPNRDGRLGLNLVRSLAAQLAARISFVNSELGLSVALQMPGKVSA